MSRRARPGPLGVLLQGAAVSLILALPAGAGAQDLVGGEEEGRPWLRWRQVRDAGVVRGVWITRWEYEDAASIGRIMSRAARRGMTDVFFQVRGRGDAFYRSEL
ncbi:MAG: hypothetical protein R6W82_04930, partial [bacterium]